MVHDKVFTLKGNTGTANLDFSCPVRIQRSGKSLLISITADGFPLSARLQNSSGIDVNFTVYVDCPNGDRMTFDCGTAYLEGQSYDDESYHYLFGLTQISGESLHALTTGTVTFTVWAEMRSPNQEFNRISQFEEVTIDSLSYPIKVYRGGEFVDGQLRVRKSGFWFGSEQAVITDESIF